MDAFTPTANFILSFTAALVLHELGHLVAAKLCGVPVTSIGLGWGPKLCRRTFRDIDCQLRVLPLGAFVQLEMAVFHRRPVNQQLLVLGAGIAVNLILAILFWGTLFGTLNLSLAVGNLLPIYQQDGWKGAIVLSRKLIGRSSAVSEWIITIAGGAIAVAVLAKALVALI
jgi:membrane-associated protease RseP (regulator of RpoE activity)